MASFKNKLFLFGFLLALVLLVSSDVTAADEKSVKTTGDQDTSSGEANEDLICKIGRCCRLVNGRCVKCCRTPEETPETESVDEDTVKTSAGEANEDLICRIGRCCRIVNGQCVRCCRTPEETPETESHVDKDPVTANALSCRHGCCRWRNKVCIKCCATPDEIPEKTEDVGEEEAKN